MSTLKLEKLSRLPVVGDVVKRIWGDGFMVTEMRVCAVDDEFISCDAQRSVGATVWEQTVPDGNPWQFDVVWGVETDVTQGWGIKSLTHPTLRNVVLSRIVP